MIRRNLLAPLSDADLEALMETKTPTVHREPNVVTLRKCPTCREWARQGSTDRCIDCGTRLPPPMTGR